MRWQAVRRFVRWGPALLGLPAVLPAQTTIDGIVRDSLSGRTLAFATVQLTRLDAPTSAGRSVISDANGQFVLDSVSPGKYLFGFLHPRLDSLGFDAVTRLLTVGHGSQYRTEDLALPSAQTLARELCGRMDSIGGVLVGRVLRASDGDALSRGHVAVQWRELTMGKSAVSDSIRSLRAAISADGRYLACGVPTDAPLTVTAISDSAATSSRSGSITVRFAESVPFLQQDMLVPRNAWSAAGEPPLGRGTASLIGHVRNASGAPIAGARVMVREAAVLDSTAVTDSSGTYRFRSLRGGTYPVDVMKLGMAPTRTSVSLRDQRTVTADFSLEALAYELGGVRVYSAYSMEAAGFAKRRATRSRSAFFMTAGDVAKEGKLLTSMVLLRAPMLGQYGSNESGHPRIGGPFGCRPLIFVDGLQEDGPPKFGARRATADGGATVEFRLDSWVRPNDIGGIEVYPPGSAPARFADDFQRCASIVIWTRAVVR
jgi:hypothetical protein